MQTSSMLLRRWGAAGMQLFFAWALVTIATAIPAGASGANPHTLGIELRDTPEPPPPGAGEVEVKLAPADDP